MIVETGRKIAPPTENSIASIHLTMPVWSSNPTLKAWRTPMTLTNPSAAFATAGPGAGGTRRPLRTGFPTPPFASAAAGHLSSNAVAGVRPAFATLSLSTGIARHSSPESFISPSIHVAADSVAPAHFEYAVRETPSVQKAAWQNAETGQENYQGTLPTQHITAGPAALAVPSPSARHATAFIANAKRLSASPASQLQRQDPAVSSPNFIFSAPNLLGTDVRNPPASIQTRLLFSPSPQFFLPPHELSSAGAREIARYAGEMPLAPVRGAEVRQGAAGQFADAGAISQNSATVFRTLDGQGGNPGTAPAQSGKTIAIPEAKPAAQQAGSVDVDELVEKAYKKLVRKIAIEQERRGHSRWF